MPSDICVVSNIRIVEVCHSLLAAGAMRPWRVDGREGGRHLAKPEVADNPLEVQIIWETK